MEESEYDINRRLDKTYISPSLPSFGDKTVKVRIATKAFQSLDDYAFATIKDEVVLRHREGARKTVKAKFFEDCRGVFVLSIQGFSAAADKPHNASFAFIGDEIGKLTEFLKHIQAFAFENDQGVNITDKELRKIIVSGKQVSQLLKENPDVLAEVLRSDVTKEDIVAIGYRKKQLDTFSKLLEDPAYFDSLKEMKKCGSEALWQRFFEKNTWIFGYGLGFLFLSSLDNKKLEQVVQGHSIVNHGKRVDALMKTRGIISNLCFIEIKTHTTALLSNKPYRAGCWAPSDELAGAVAQVQGTVHSAVETIGAKLTLKDDNGAPTGEEAFNYQPRSFLVIGSLNEFVDENGVNADKYRSFELYRKNTVWPEIITFDELYERARYVVNHNG
jgi:hypothetical protein